MRTPARLESWFLMLALASSAGAQPASSPKADAKMREETGTRLYNAQQYAKAAEEYQQAYLLDPQPLYLYSSAQALRLAGDCTRALRSYHAFLRTNPSADGADKATKNIERCEQELKDHPPVVEPHVAPAVAPPSPPPPAPSQPPPPPVRASTSWTGDWAGHGLVAGGVVAGATGAVLFFRGRAAIEANNTAPTYAAFVAGRGDLDAAKRNQVIGVSAMAVGGALLLGGVLHYALHGRGGSEPSHVTTAIDSTQATVVVTGAF